MEESRKQFEAWFNNKSFWKITPSMRTKKGYINNPSAQEKWEVWKASRAAIEIELPDWFYDMHKDQSIDRNETIKSIRAAGLTVKGDSK